MISVLWSHCFSLLSSPPSMCFIFVVTMVLAVPVILVLPSAGSVLIHDLVYVPLGAGTLILCSQEPLAPLVPLTDELLVIVLLCPLVALN